MVYLIFAGPSINVIWLQKTKASTMWWRLLTICVCAGIVSGRSTSESLLVNIEQGPVRGYKLPQGGLYVFYNIPYATAPIGLQKFKVRKFTYYKIK